MPDTDAIIGRVGVKVLPDTDDFRRTAQRELDAIEKALKPIKVELELDADSLDKKVKSTVAAAEAKTRKDLTLHMDLEGEDSLKRALNQIDRELEKLRETELKVELNEEDLEAARDLIGEQLHDVGREAGERFEKEFAKATENLEVDPFIDERESRRALRRIEEYADKIASLKATITPEMNEVEQRRVERQIEDLEDKIEDIRSTIDVNVDQPSRSLAAASLAILARTRVVTLIPKVSEAAFAKATGVLSSLSGFHQIKNILGDLGDSIEGLFNRLPLVGSIALAILGLGGYALTAASNLAALSASLASIGPAALTVPGILGGLAIGIGGTIAVLKDFNDEIPMVLRNLKQLQNRMSETFYARAEAPMRRMFNQLLPQFSAGMERTSHSLGGFFANLSDSVRETFDGAFKGMFDDLNKSIDIAGKHTDSFAGIIKTLGEAGAGRLPQLSKWFGGLADEFDTFLSEAEKDGRLDKWIDESIIAMKDLGSATGDFFGILSGIGRAATAAGGSSLGLLADTMEKVHKVVDSPGFQKALTGVFEAAHKAMSIISDRAGPQFQNFMKTMAKTLETVLPRAAEGIGAALGGLFDALSQPAVQKGFIDFIDGVASAFESLAPAFRPMGEAFGELLSLAGDLAKEFGPVLAEILIAIADAVTVLAPALKPLVKVLTRELLEAIKDLTPHLEDMVTSFSEWLKDGGIEKIGRTFGAILDLVVALTPETVKSVGKLVDAIVDLAPAVEAIAASVKPVMDFIEMLGDLTDASGGLGALQLTPKQEQEARGQWEGVELFFKAKFGNIKEAGQTLEKWFEVDLHNSVMGALGSIGNFFTGSGDSVNSAKQPLLSLQGILQGMGPKFANFAAKADKHFANAKTFISNHATTIGSVIKGMWDGQVEKARNVVRDIAGAFKNLPGRILWFVRNFDTLLFNAGVDLLTGFLEGIKDAAPAVEGFLIGFTRDIPMWKGPPSKDASLLFDAGASIMDGFLGGLESRYDVVRKSLGGLTRDIGGMTAETSRLIGGAVGMTGSQPNGGKTLNYYAAPGSSLDSEEDLFAAADRMRMGW